MSYQFVNQQKASAIITETDNSYKIAGVNGKQTDANNFNTAMTGLLRIVGKDETTHTKGRTITQNVEEESP